jgi:hypothetical protein
MTKPKRVGVGPIFHDRKAAERAAAVLRIARLNVEIVEIELLLCPGAIRKQARMVQVHVGDLKLAERHLREAGVGS